MVTTESGVHTGFRKEPKLAGDVLELANITLIVCRKALICAGDWLRSGSDSPIVAGISLRAAPSHS